MTEEGTTCFLMHTYIKEKIKPKTDKCVFLGFWKKNLVLLMSDKKRSHYCLDHAQHAREDKTSFVCLA